MPTYHNWCGNKQWAIVEGWVLYWVEAETGYWTGKLTALANIDLLPVMIYDFLMWPLFWFRNIWSFWMNSCLQSSRIMEKKSLSRLNIGFWLLMIWIRSAYCWYWCLQFVPHLWYFCSLKTSRTIMHSHCLIDTADHTLCSMMIFRYLENSFVIEISQISIGWLPLWLLLTLDGHIAFNFFIFVCEYGLK